MFRYQTQQQMEVRSTKMPRKMQEEALMVAKNALDRNSEPRAAAEVIKREFDRRYCPNWHCIVGNHFGSFITHIEDNYIHFNHGKTAILLWKTS